MGVGGSFDVAAGSVARAPKVFRVTGTEFLFRILSEPRKRWSHNVIILLYLLRIIKALSLYWLKSLTAFLNISFVSI